MEHRYFSIDIGGTAIKYAHFDRGGKMQDHGHVLTPDNRADFVKVLDQLVGKQEESVVGIGVSVPGIVNPMEATVTFTGVLSFMGTVDLASHIRQVSGCPVFIGNDANCATLAELWQGQLKGVKNGAMVTLGTSIGGGIVIDGRLKTGLNFKAGQLSAMGTDFDQPSRESTVGATTSAVDMLRRIAKACNLKDPNDGWAAFELINEGDERAQPIFTSFCRRVALTLINLQAVLDLDRILLGGGISGQPVLITEVNDQFESLLNQDPRLMAGVTKPEIVAAHFGNQANLYGALDGLLMHLNHEFTQY
jgi:predicted NBD/HSP70 family sugar kinase